MNMKVSPTRRRQIEDRKTRARLLYQTGLSMRDVAKAVERSHQWVCLTIHEKQSPAVTSFDNARQRV